jgi:DNA-binding transcriptional LysR family regulator
MDTLNGMAVFARVIEMGSFSAAARDLRLAKSTVSKQVAALEQRLGARLLNRTTRRLSPTEVGRAYYERCTRIIAEVEEAELAVSRLQLEPRGTLRLNAPMSFGNLHVAPVIADFMNAYPELTVDMTLNDRLVDLVDEGFDVAVRIGKLADSTLIAKKIAPSRQVVCAAPEYWQAHGIPARPQDISNHNCLIYTYLRNPHEWIFKMADGVKTVSITGKLRANNGEALRAAALKGYGVYLGPTFIVGEDLRSGRLQAVLRDFEIQNHFIHAVYPHSRHLSVKVRAFVDFLAERFGDEPYWDLA